MTSGVMSRTRRSPMYGPDVVVRVLAVIEAGLQRQVLVGVHPVEVEIEELVDLQAGRRCSELAPVDLAEDLPALPGGLGHGGEAPPGDLVTACPVSGSWPTVTLKYHLPVCPGTRPVVWPALIHPPDTLENISVLTMFSRGCSQLKRSVENRSDLDFLARSEGFEPPTF